MPVQGAAFIGDGWLSGLRRVPSPNCNERPSDATVNLLVIHGISLPPGEFHADSAAGGYIDQLFTDTLDIAAHPFFESLSGVRVSAHFLISRAGVVTQYVPVTMRAWHAGTSSWQGRENCNDFSIGIELEGADDVPYDDAQYVALAGLTRVLQGLFPGVKQSCIVGHSDIAPSRKTDPGVSFDWDRFGQLMV